MSRIGLPQIFVRDRKTNDRFLLPKVQINFVEDELNGIGSASIGFDPLAENAQEVLLTERELELQDGDDMVYVGALRDIRGNSTRLEAPSDGLFSYFQYRFVLQDNLIYTDTEQIQIAANLITYAQTDISQGTNANLAIVVGNFGGSGIIRTREYVSERKHNLFEALSEFPTLEQGFDQAIIASPNGSRVWTPFYPTRGTVKDIPLEYGREITDYQYIESSKKQATKVAATGGIAEQVDGARIKQEFTYEDVVASQKYGVHVAVLPSGARSDLAWLEARAKAAVNIRKAPIRIPEITLKDASTLRKLLAVGDSVPVRINHGRVQIAGEYRIQKIRWEPLSNELKLTFLEPVEG